MVTIKQATDQKCFICSTKEETVEVSFADKTFRGVLCMKHVYEKVRVNRAASGGGSKAP